MSDQSQTRHAVVGLTTLDQLGKDLDLYSERARSSLTFADQEARGFNHNYVGTEHLLIGILDVEDGVAAKALANLGVQPERVRPAIVQAIGRGTEPVTGEIGLTPRAKQVLVLARDEARQFSHHYVGTEHILLALLREGEGVAAGILANLSVDLEKARVEVLQVLSSTAKGNVITCRIWPRDLEAIDLLVEAGIRNTRSDAAAWLIHAGIEGNRELFERVQATVADIRRLRQQVQAVARELAGRPQPTPPATLS
jgi:ATP-dependent Clp protease ATP-binding subunit ClpA